MRICNNNRTEEPGVCDEISCQGEMLLQAATDGRAVDVRRLLDAGADLIYRSEEGWTALHTAAFRGHEEVLAVLLERGANVHDIDPNLNTPLHLAVFNHNGRCVLQLIKAGAPLEDKNAFGDTPLHTAAELGFVTVIRLLLAAGASKVAVNYEREMPFEKSKIADVQNILKP